MQSNCGQSAVSSIAFNPPSISLSDVLAWLGLEATGFGLALGGFGFQDLQAKP
jgi:hypothetical protein